MTTQHDLPLLASIVDLAGFRGVPSHQVRYAILSRAIQPAHVTGAMKLFNAAGQRAILDALDAITLHPSSAPARLRRATTLQIMA